MTLTMERMKLLILFTIIIATYLTSSVDGRSKKPKCAVCKGIAEKFDEGLKNTAKSNFGGGNTRWEEKSLGSYQFSETRLVEIMEQLCSENDCHNFIEEWEDDIEKWWFKHFAKGKDEDFHKYICIELTKACCPTNTFGPECEPCPGGTERPCKGNGHCNGEGTREGTGKCDCNGGYTGDMCDECQEGYYEETTDENNVACTACHESCEKGCHKEGPGGCHDCKKGWRQNLNDVCEDVNECEEDEENKLCEGNRFCRNTEGSHECEGCNEACEGCTGFGADKCNECKEKYFKEGDICKACDKACKSSCTGVGPTACDECTDGYILNENDGCQDVNECEAETSPCKDNEYCRNTHGSYYCRECPNVCNGCTGGAYTDCKECAPGYVKNEDTGTCEDIDECVSTERVCKGDHEKCANTDGGYDCVCMKGYIRRGGKCERKQKASVSYSKPACDICKDIVSGFQKGIEKTNKQNFGGGNTQWEEKKLGAYAYSETRFVEITEDICSDSDKDCNRMMENNEKFLEQWWFSHFAKEKETDLHTYFCINRAEACCPNGTYGSACTDCPGGKDNPCNGNGECNGAGSREGTGKCKCNDGYDGDLCTQCANDHYEQRNSAQVTCHGCDESCDESCTGEGPKNCDSCKKGYEEREGEGCTDVDECAVDSGSCGENKYCSNTVGSFSCEACSSACNGCTGAGNDKCVECAANYFKEGNNCFECHNSCNGCTGPGGKNCVECGTGWELKGGTCTDINECQAEKAACSADQYCLNNLGSYRCHGCHKACDSCIGAGVDQCTKCAKGYSRSGEDGADIKCVDIDECASGTVCLDDGEVCINTVGSYKCNCDDKYTRKDGKCIKLKEKKKPKNKKKKKQVVKEKTEEEKQIDNMIKMVDVNESPEKTADKIKQLINEAQRDEL